MKIIFGVIISSNSEWEALKSTLPSNKLERSPYGDFFLKDNKVFLHGGYGKVDAAASAQYLISRWNPNLVFNLGTCGGIHGEVEKGEIILVKETIIYDIYEKMTDPNEAIKAYSTTIDLSWIGTTLPLDVRQTTMLSADRDLSKNDIPHLKNKFCAKVVDWESGSIARVCKKNDVDCLILRGVSDTVCLDGEISYENNLNDYKNNSRKLIPLLVSSLPEWEKIYTRSKNL